MIPRTLLPLLLRRTLVLWILLRLLLGIPGAMVGVWLLPSPGLSTCVAVLLAVVMFLDLRRRGERILWADLGAGLPAIGAAALVIGLIAEAALGLALGSMRGVTG
ncbi:MAG: hypothetical protein ACREOJ_17810 [Gemmatimonadaceae bacterium]